MLTYIKGDLLNDAPCLKRRIIVQCNNDIGAYGAGVSGAISKKYPKVEEEYKHWCKYEHYMLGTKNIPFKLEHFSSSTKDKLSSSRSRSIVEKSKFFIKFFAH